MSLINGSLQIGGSGLMASQAAIQVIGNNVANASDPNYALRTPVVEPAVGGSGELGSGVQLAGVQRMTDEAINARLRGATSDQSAAQAATTIYSQLETTFNPLGTDNLSDQMTSFFNAFTQLANDPQDATNRTMLLQAGDALAGQINSANQAIQDQRTQINAQLGTMTEQANRLVAQVADLNGQIATTQSGLAGASAAGLLDQRDADLSQLSGLLNVQTIASDNGAVNVYLNSAPLVQGGQAFSLTTAADPNSTRGDQIVQVVGFQNSATVTGGSIGGLLTARSQGLDYAQDQLDALASGVINAVNEVHSQGQGLTGQSSFTGSTALGDPTAALNQAGLGLTPVNGTFNILVTDPSGQTTTQTVDVDLAGLGADDSLTTLAGKISAVAHVTATVLPSGQLSIEADSGYTLGFSQDSSHVLAALGINTFFSGESAATMAVRGDLTASGVAASLNGLPGDNSNALNLAAVADQPIDALGGATLSAQFTATLGTLASRSAQTSSDLTSANTLSQALTTQQASVSGVNTDQQTVDLMKYQQAYEGAAHYLSVVNQLVTDLLTLV